VNPMGNKRGRPRVDFKNPCILTHEGTSYLGLLVNLSPSGAFVKVANGHTDRILCIGDTVVLKLCINPDSSPAEYYGTVIRLEASGLGVTFKR
jgi:hypothetical protein